MTPAWREKLAAGARTLGVTLDAGQVMALSALCERLIQWNRKIDLSSIKDPDQIREKHVLDSLAGVPMLRPEDRRIGDLGSGGGFPGLVLAIAEPSRSVISVESRGKKSVFQRQVARELGLTNFEARSERIEDARFDADLITARALADVDELLRLAEKWLSKGASLLAYKSSKVDAELEAAQPRMAALSVRVVERRDFTLPESGEPRTLIRLSAREGGGGMLTTGEPPGS